MSIFYFSQAQKMSEEAHGLGSMCTRVSAELKCARSVVRLTEIQTTLQEQRYFLIFQFCTYICLIFVAY